MSSFGDFRITGTLWLPWQQVRMTFKFLHNARLIRWIQQNKIYKKLIHLTRDWTQITCLAVSHSNHYTRMFSMLVWGCNWILFMHRWFCLIRLIHLIGWKSLHFEKETDLQTASKDGDVNPRIEMARPTSKNYWLWSKNHQKSLLLVSVISHITRRITIGWKLSWNLLVIWTGN